MWGSLRAGSTLGGPSQRYCANLGHVADDESGLVYMRARFYEPWSGRFVSEGFAMDGRNWYVCATNLPSTATDFSGRSPEGGGAWSFDPIKGMNANEQGSFCQILFMFGGVSSAISFLSSGAEQKFWAITAAACFAACSYGVQSRFALMEFLKMFTLAILPYIAIISLVGKNGKALQMSATSVLAVGLTTYALICIAELVAMDMEAMDNDS